MELEYEMLLVFPSNLLFNSMLAGILLVYAALTLVRAQDKTCTTGGAFMYHPTLKKTTTQECTD